MRNFIADQFTVPSRVCVCVCVCVCVFGGGVWNGEVGCERLCSIYSGIYISSSLDANVASTSGHQGPCGRGKQGLCLGDFYGLC